MVSSTSSSESFDQSFGSRTLIIYFLLTKGYTIASIDELYLFLTNMTAVEYIRNFMKRVRKKEI